MEQKTLIGYERKELKKGPSRRLRREGKIPAIVYGHGTPTTISVEQKEFQKRFRTISSNTILTLKVGKKEYEVLVKGFQEDLIKDVITHIDFFELERGKLLRTKVPVHVEGSAKGVREGGVLEQRIHELEIECLPKDIPDNFIVIIDELLIGDTIHVGDIAIPEGVKVLNMAEQAVVSVTNIKEEVVETPAEEELEEGETPEEEAEAEKEEE